MALVERQSTPTRSVQVHGSVESRGSGSQGSPVPAEGSPDLGTGEPTPMRARGSGKVATFVARARANVWTPVALRVLGIGAGMLGLACIGAFATAHDASGYALSPGPAVSGPAPQRIAQASLTPPRDDARASQGSPAQAPPKAPSVGMTADGKVILNLATAEDLRHLPGVGKKRAEAIVALREKLGGKFRRINDLLRLRGIGPRRLKLWLPLLVLEAPAPTPVPSASAAVPLAPP